MAVNNIDPRLALAIEALRKVYNWHVYTPADLAAAVLRVADEHSKEADVTMNTDPRVQLVADTMRKEMQGGRYSFHTVAVCIVSALDKFAASAPSVGVVPAFVDPGTLFYAVTDAGNHWVLKRAMQRDMFYEVLEVALAHNPKARIDQQSYANYCREKVAGREFHNVPDTV